MKHIIVAAAMIIMASGCNVYRDYNRHEEADIAGLFGDDVVPAEDSVTIASIPWRDFFSDPYLQALIDTGLCNNSDLRIASLRVEEAEASLRSARLAYLPSVSLTPQGALSSYDGGKSVKTYSLGLSADWEIDMAGRITNQKRGAYASVQEQRSYRQAVATQLVATVANTYYNLLTFDQQLSISRQSLDAWNEIIRTFQVRKRAGEASEASVAQAIASKHEVEISILSLTRQIDVMENSLCALLGWTPRHIARGALDNQTFPETLRVGVPLQMLENRPDIRQAEYALMSAFYATNVARSAFYPSLTLSGSAGWTNNSGAAIVNPGSWLLNALGSLTQPIFNKGRNIANLKIAEARQEEAMTAFRQKLLDAGAEVNNALCQWQNAQARLDVSRQRIEALESAVRSTRLLMEHSDGGSYLEVQTAQQSLLSAQLTATEQTFDKIQGMINLYHALGGGR